MKKYKGYLIDLDGTMYRGKEKIEEASDFIKYLKLNNIPYLFVTNNSSSKPETVASKLNSFDIPASSEQIITTSIAAASFISEQKADATVYYIGEEGLKDALEKKGLQIKEDRPDYVVVGLDREITYEKLAKACLAVREGSTFISTNADIAFPSERGLLPGNGSLTSVITVSTQTEPIFIGKPEARIMELSLEALRLNKDEVLMVGDNYHTDILAGIHAGIDTLFVNTGVTRVEELETFSIKPTHVIHSLDEWKF